MEKNAFSVTIADRTILSFVISQRHISLPCPSKAFSNLKSIISDLADLEPALLADDVAGAVTTTAQFREFGTV